MSAETYFLKTVDHGRQDRGTQTTLFRFSYPNQSKKGGRMCIGLGGGASFLVYLIGSTTGAVAHGGSLDQRRRYRIPCTIV